MYYLNTYLKISALRQQIRIKFMYFLHAPESAGHSFTISHTPCVESVPQLSNELPIAPGAGFNSQLIVCVQILPSTK